MRRAELAGHGQPPAQVGDHSVPCARPYHAAGAELPPASSGRKGRMLPPELQQRSILFVSRPQLLRQTRQVPRVGSRPHKIVRRQIQFRPNPFPSTGWIEPTERQVPGPPQHGRGRSQLQLYQFIVLLNRPPDDTAVETFAAGAQPLEVVMVRVQRVCFGVLQQIQSLAELARQLTPGGPGRAVRSGRIESADAPPLATY